jgi:hypothetical protein
MASEKTRTAKPALRATYFVSYTNNPGTFLAFQSYYRSRAVLPTRRLQVVSPQEERLWEASALIFGK